MEYSQCYDKDGLPILHPGDLEQLEKLNIFGLKMKGLYGILERLIQAGIIDIDLNLDYDGDIYE